MQDRNLQRFIAQRTQINKELDRTCNQVDAWVSTCGKGDTATLVEYALLEGLIVARQAYLAEMIDVNHAFGDYLSSLRNAS
jgi:hypothetical protein